MSKQPTAKPPAAKKNAAPAPAKVKAKSKAAASAKTKVETKAEKPKAPKAKAEIAKVAVAKPKPAKAATAKVQAPPPKPKAVAKPKVAAQSPPPRAAAKPAPKAKSAPQAASKPAPQPAPRPAPEAAAPPRIESPSYMRGATLPKFDAIIPADQRAAFEALSANLARAAVTAQGAIAEAALRQADRPAALSPDPFHVGPALTEVMGRLAGQPDLVMRAQADLFSRYLELWQSATRRMQGEDATPVVEPAKGDRRFADAEWSKNPVFDVMKQSYLLTANWLNDLVGEVDEVDQMSKRRVEVFMKMLTDAFSPSNFLLSNPAALREAMETKGESLVRGMENFAADLERGGGQLAISQTDLAKFKVGENVATAPGQVVYQNDLLQLLQFTPTTATVHEIPLVIFPPWINKYYIMDLRPENSLIRWLTDQGFTVFVASWVNPDAAMASKSFEDYLIDGVYAATEQAMIQCDVKTVNTVGYCIAGTLLSCALAHMAAKGDKRIASATFFAAQQDFSEAGDLLLFTDDAWIADLEQRIDQAGGFLPSQSMADTFNMLRSNDLIWSFFVSNYLMGKEPRPFDLLFWNHDQTRMPKALHLFYLRNFYRDNALAKGVLELDGVKLDLSKVKTPIYVQSSREDHIAPYRSVYRGARLFGGPVTFIMAGSGHIAGVINAPVAQKYQHWTNDHLPASVEGWQAGAVEHPGSWWPNWKDWLAAKSGKQVPARDPTQGKLKPIEPAPGAYVKVKS